MVDAAWNLILRTLNPCGSHSPPLAALIARVSETDVLLTTGRRLAHLYNTPPLGAGILYPRRVWRLQTLRGWSDEQADEVLTGGAGAGRADGVRASRRACLGVGGDQLDRVEDRVHGRNAAGLGSPGRA